MGQGIKSDLKQFNHNLIHCTNCPRLVEFRTRIAAEKRKQFMDWDYWGKPVPGYGDPEAEIIIVGLAPAAHGGNRTVWVKSEGPVEPYALLSLVKIPPE